MTLSTNNVKTLKEESSQEFRNEIDKVNAQMNKAEEKNLEIIRKSIEDNISAWESRFKKLKEAKEEEASGCKESAAVGERLKNITNHYPPLNHAIIPQAITPGWPARILESRNVTKKLNNSEKEVPAVPAEPEKPSLINCTVWGVGEPPLNF